MKNSVVIKSSKLGLTLILDPDISFEQLVRDICTKFASTKDFFGKVTLVLSLEGRTLDPEETGVIIEAIELNSDITISLLEENGGLKDKEMQGKIDKFYFEKFYDNAKIIKGSISNKQRLQSDSSILILGDVKAGAKVEAAGNVIVLGRIAGAIHAGYPDHNSCYIVADEIATDTLSIGSIQGEPRMEKKWFIRRKRISREPVAVVVWEKELLMEPLESGLIKHI